MSLKLSIIANNHLCFRIGSYRVKKRLNAVVPNSIITVKEKQPFASRGFDPNVSTDTKTIIRLMDNLDACILLRIVIAHLKATVGRAIINKNDFKILVGLDDDAPHTFVKILFYLTDMGNYRYQ